MPADLVFLNGTVVTIDDARPAAEAVAVVGNRIARVGTTDEVRQEVGPGTRVVDLAGRALLPGFNDNHTHPISYGLGLILIDARPATVPSWTSSPDRRRGRRSASAPRSARAPRPAPAGGGRGSEYAGPVREDLLLPQPPFAQATAEPWVQALDRPCVHRACPQRH